MIKARLLIDRGSDQSPPLLRVRNVIRNYGIEFTDDNPDIWIIHSTKLKKTDLLRYKIPTIILERIDSACISKRKEIYYPNVIGVIKNTIFRDKQLNNEMQCEGRYHGHLISKSSNNSFNVKCRKHPNQLSNEIMDKVEIGYSFGSYSQMTGHINTRVDFTSLRPIDLQFAGCTSYGKKTINHHRKLAVLRSSNLKGVNTDVSLRWKYRKGAYRGTLLKSKSVLSPWGLGEACYRDFEALYLGSILLKPDTSFVECWPDIYINNKTYIPCKIDFSDLQQKIDYIVQNWGELQHMREQNLKMLKHCWKREVIAERIANIIKKCSTRI